MLSVLLGPDANLEDSAALDRAIGLHTRVTEDSLRALPPGVRVERWNHLSPEVFQTPYSELAEILDRLRVPVGGLVVDLGAAYGRLGFLIAARRPDLKFLGIEIVRERVREANRVAALHRLKPPAFSLREGDLSHHELENLGLAEADAFFTYDFGTLDDVSGLLRQLQAVARKRPIQLVARGGRSRSQIQSEHPWLTEIFPPEHRPNWSLYRSAAPLRE